MPRASKAASAEAIARPGPPGPASPSQAWEVRVELKPGVLDAEAEAVGKALRLLGIEGIGGVSVARVYRLTFEGCDAKEARRRADLAVERLLANPVIHRVEVHALQSAGSP